MKFGKVYVNLVPRVGSFWVGLHYSKLNESLCVALVPCIVLRLGLKPYRQDPDIYKQFKKEHKK